MDAETARVAIETAKVSAGVKYTLKSQQIESIESFLRGNDTFVNLPTGFGKSLVYQLAPYCADYIRSNSKDASVEGKAIAIVVSPLIALMRDQVKKLNRNDITTAGYIGDMKDDPKEMNKLQKGQVKIVFASPETLLGPLGRRILSSSPYQTNVCGFFIDEGHCVAKWGFKSGKLEAFRHCYSHLAELRSLVPSTVPMVALTATSSPDVKQLIEQSLGMTNVCSIQVSPERTNIKYSVMHMTAKQPEVQFGWLLEEVKRHSNLTPKVIIFCQSHRQCREIHAGFEEVLGKEMAIHMAMFHSCSEEKRKEDIINDFTKANSTIRVLIATVAFGMGIHVENLHSAIHYGPSRTINDYFQETGRIGREGEQSYAVLLKYPGCLSSCKVEQSMKDYMNSSECRRSILLNYYGYTARFDVVKHLCCDNCSSTCDCAIKQCQILEVNEGWCFTNLKKMESLVSKPKEGRRTRIIDETQKQELRQKIMNYRDSILEGHESALYSGVDMASGLSMSLVDTIVEDCHTICTFEQLENYPFFSAAVLSKVWSLITDTLGSEFEPLPSTNRGEVSIDSDDSEESLSMSEEGFTRPVTWFSEHISSTDSTSCDDVDDVQK